MDKTAILIIDDDRRVLDSLAKVLKLKDYFPITLDNPLRAQAALAEREFSCILLDVSMPGLSGLDLLEQLQESHPHIPIIMVSAFATINDAVRALKHGAYDFIEKPIDPDSLLVKIANALDRYRQHVLNRKLVELLKKQSEIVGQSNAIQKVVEQIRVVAPTAAKVLILGETGTGKELVARALHLNSTRVDKPYVKINCAAIPSELLESELFGHKKGSYTGASSDREGKFMAANGGTIFLDEIGDMDLRLQSKLLRVLQDGDIEVIGDIKPLKVDVRIIAATNQKLWQRVKEGHFREDLYHRLNVVSINIPPLRDRVEDIPLLLHHFLSMYCDEYNRGAISLTPAAIEFYQRHPWPGNVRELSNITEKLVIFMDGNQVDIETAQQSIQQHGLQARTEQSVPAQIEAHGSLQDARDEFERGYILAMLRKHHGRINRAAAEMEIDRSNLYKKMKRLGIDQQGNFLKNLPV
jgi:DNA-binding NtrC family response regulator